MEDQDHPQPVFQLVKKVQENIWLARRIAQHIGYADGEEFIARKVDDFDEYYDAGKYALGFTTKKQRQIKGLMDLLYECNFGRNVSHILNHENIISLAGYLRQQPFHSQVQATEDYLIWDICDAGNLELLFADRHSEREPDCFLPESLCWHVLTSILRALVWLHDGHRQQVNWETGEVQWVRTDMEWMPILHRGISGQSVFFQHSRGQETYGVCKLGKFGRVFVSGIPARREATYSGEKPVPNSEGFPLAPRQGHMELHEMRKQWNEYIVTGEKSKRLYTISDDHWALGAVLFRMMAGFPLPSLDGCQACGCVHIRRCLNIQCIGGDDHLGRGCEHPNILGCKCVEPCDDQTDIHIDETLMRMGYSKYLKLAVRLLLDYDLLTPAAGSQHLSDEIEVLYQKWRNKTEEGREYVDVLDDLRGKFFSLNGMDDMME
ncbi:G2-specific serine threonine protein kinase [Colletotrichum truncatum]|uniref:G2-specific serine threonine protein kinase n=1 Tax=Colletotrichum truncatum TaxID=5467 RepID=A0ACC3ZCP5_COLTU|nr:G2-specific serine threonine protein kinase [Colletotrichum truncatum]KAF6797838.1 G2-specific serine threonine protein kinase [Colletotrichum truncatum]